MPDRGLHFHYTDEDKIGYGRMGRELHRALSKYVTVDTSQPRDARTYHTVLSGTIPGHVKGWYHGQHSVLLTMWETMRMPESIRETLHNFDQILVPSAANVLLFSRYHDNVLYTPLGVDPEKWEYAPRQAPTNEFRFLISGSSKRKGVDLAAKAFHAAFPKARLMRPRPRLFIKAVDPRNVPNDQDITVLSGYLSAEEEVALYSRAHCYVQPSRGEGWGLQPLQAIAQGCPTILTDAHGHRAFSYMGRGIPTENTKSDYHIFGDSGEWWEPDFDALVNEMRWVYENYEHACDVSTAFSKVARDWFSWDMSAKAVLRNIGYQNLVPDHTDRSLPFKILDIKLYRIVTLRDYTCTIGPTTYAFRAGEPYYVPADVKRVLYEKINPLLDPVCLTEDDPGLTTEQLAGLPEYLDRAMHCPTCGQELPRDNQLGDVDV